jgi:ribosome-associated protein
MPRKKKKSNTEILTDVIVDAMLAKKAKDPVVMEFSKVPGASFDAFVICHGTSRTQVEAIADNVLRTVRSETGDHPWHKEGFENAEWVLIDYSDVVVHIFQDSRRMFYNLEQLWADAEIRHIEVKE